MTSVTNLSFSDIKKSLPQELMQPSTAKAVQTLALSTLFLGVSVLAMSYFPWYLLPIGWAFTALVASGVIFIVFNH
jgi:fatty acid desaturase